MEKGIWGAMGGAVAAIIIGFVWGGWTTSGTTQRMSDEATDAAVLTTRAAICVAQFMMEPNHQENLNELKELSSFDRRDFLNKGGWDKMPGQEVASLRVSRACAEGLEILMEK